MQRTTGALVKKKKQYPKENDGREGICSQKKSLICGLEWQKR